MSETIFPDGARFWMPNKGAPDFVKGKISIKVDEFASFLQENAGDDGQVNLDLNAGKSGNWYLKLDTWKPENKGGSGNAVDSDIPF